MKKLLSIGFVLMMAISLTACGSGANNGGDSAKKSSEVAKSSGKISREEGVKKLEALAEKIQNGEITAEEYKKQSKEISKNMETTGEMMKRTNDNISTFDGMPSWAKAVNINEPKGLTLIASKSSITKAKGSYPDGFSAVYEGDKETLISEAKRITKELNLKTDFEDAASGTFMAAGDVDKYTVAISIANNKEGMKMYYSATDLTAQEELRKKYNK